MILQQKALFDLAVIYLCVAICSHEYHNMHVPVCLCTLGTKIPLAISCVCSLQCYFGPADHSILSSPCGLCFADRTTWKPESNLQSLANEGTEGIMEEIERCQEGCLDDVQLDKRPLLSIFTVRSKAICSSTCLLLVHFMTHFWLYNWKFLARWLVGTSWPYPMQKKNIRYFQEKCLWCSDADTNTKYLFACPHLTRTDTGDAHRQTQKPLFLTCF